MRAIDNRARRHFAGLIGLDCTRRQVTVGRGLVFGLGTPMPHERYDQRDSYFGTYELGTTSAPWRIVKGARLVLGNGSRDDEDGLDQALQKITPGKFVGIEAMSAFDLRLWFESVYIDLMGTSGNDEPLFSLYGPNRLAISYRANAGWSVGEADEPWPRPNA